MARVPVPRVFHPVTVSSECHVRFDIGTKQGSNQFGYQWNNTTAPSAAELLSLATEVWGTIVVKMALAVTPRVVFREVYCRNIDTETAPENTYVPSSPLPGSRGGGNAPSQVAFSLIKRTGLTGKSHHSSEHFSGFSINDIVGDLVQSGLLSLLMNIATSILAPRVSGRFIPAIPSRKLGDSRRLSEIAYENAVVDTMDRRTNE